MSKENIVDSLLYACYAHNRNMTPSVTPEEWQACFDAPVGPMEARYQAEQAARFERWLVNAQNRIEAHAYAEHMAKVSPASKQFEVDRESGAL